MDVIILMQCFPMEMNHLSVGLAASNERFHLTPSTVSSSIRAAHVFSIAVLATTRLGLSQEALDAPDKKEDDSERPGSDYA